MNPVAVFDNQQLVKYIQEQYRLDLDGIHGISHWMRVREIGAALAARTGADPTVVEAFALIHDACRESNSGDAYHGVRSAELAARLNPEYLQLDPLRLQYLQFACRYHNDGKISTNVTIGTCWDADRLDLWRIGIEPDPGYLSTEAARSEDFRVWAANLFHREPDITVCGAEDVEGYCRDGITHMIRIVNPGTGDFRPTWFKGKYLQLEFGDVISVSDAAACNTLAPSPADITAALACARAAWADESASLLVSCDYGASRSPALAAVLLADHLGSGHEQEALECIMRVRPESVPNKLVIELGDVVLERNGMLRKAAENIYRSIEAELQFLM